MIDVAFTAAQARPAELTIVIDVLRATSTIAQALDAGYRSVLCADGIERARALAEPGRVLAGERRCLRPPGFELGNSPADTDPPRGEQLVLATTNGAPAIVRAAERSQHVLAGCLLNLDAIVEASADADDIQLLCAGTDGRPALEDIYVAGRLAARLCDPIRTDAAHVAVAVAYAYPCARDALAASANARLLAAQGLAADVDWCARESTLSAVPWLTASGDGVATLEPTPTTLEIH